MCSQPGLNVVTGESGSGKSVLVEALGQILGASAPDDCVRPPAKTAVVEGVVTMSPASQVGHLKCCRLTAEC